MIAYVTTIFLSALLLFQVSVLPGRIGSGVQLEVSHIPLCPLSSIVSTIFISFSDSCYSNLTNLRP